MEIRVLMVLARPPSALTLGRMNGIRTAERFLKELGAVVDFAYVMRENGETRLDGGTIVPRPSLTGILWNVFRYVLTGGLCLNECLFYSKRGRRRFARIFDQEKYDLVFCDMLRVYELVSGFGIPVVIDFDDLLSERYRKALRAGTASVDMLGYLKSEMDQFGFVGRKVVRAIFRLETVLIRRRESLLAKKCAACSLVSHKEAKLFSERINRQVHVLPVAVDVPGESEKVLRTEKRSGVAFLGKMDYAPNLDAIRFFGSKVLPLLQREQPDFVLEIIGFCPDSIRREHACQGLRFVGYVPDLQTALRGYACLVAPLVSGSGIKTKVLDAMAAGVPVIGTDIAFEGIGVVDGRDAVVANTPQELAQAIRKIAANPESSTGMIASAQELVAKEFGVDILRQRWKDLLLEVFPQKQINICK